MNDKDYSAIGRGCPVHLICLRPDADGNLFSDAVVLVSEVKRKRNGQPLCPMTFGTVEMSVGLNCDGSCSVDERRSALWKEMYPVKWCLYADAIPGIMDDIVAKGGPSRFAPDEICEGGCGGPHSTRQALGVDAGLVRLFARLSREARKEGK